MDTSGILRSDLDFTRKGYAVTSSVLAEILDEPAKAAIDAAIGSGNVVLAEPKADFIARVRKSASDSGDLEGMSSTDLDVLAVALEGDFIVVSDDYRIQNVASVLGIEFETTIHEGIRHRLRWFRVCTGCGRKYPMNAILCSVCGSELRKKAVRVKV